MYRQSSLLRSVLRPGETTPRHRQKMTDLAPRTPAVPVPYAESIEGVPYTKIRELGEIAMALDGVLRLYFGESTLGTPRFIVDAAVRALREGFTFYSENAGLPGLRGAIARQYSALHGLDVDPASQIVVTAGGAQAPHLGSRSPRPPGGGGRGGRRQSCPPRRGRTAPRSSGSRTASRSMCRFSSITAATGSISSSWRQPSRHAPAWSS